MITLHTILAIFPLLWEIMLLLHPSLKDKFSITLNTKDPWNFSINELIALFINVANIIITIIEPVGMSQVNGIKYRGMPCSPLKTRKEIAHLL